MEALLGENVDPEELKKFELLYAEQLSRGLVSSKAQFEYAWCLIRSKYQQDMKKGVALLEDLCHKTQDDVERRDYLFYMSVGYAKIKEYEPALKYAKAILKMQPGNKQALELEKFIKGKMKREGLMGMAIVGGAVLALGGLVAVGASLAKK